METVQTNQIQNNLVEIIKATRCDTSLLARLQQAGLLNPEEVEFLELTSLTSFQKSKKLYEILPTRIGSYKILIESLQELKQSEAVRILQNIDPKLHSFGLITIDECQLLGNGRSGTKVFRGKYDNRNVAVKVLNPILIRTEKALQEIELYKKLDDHENIVRYFMAETKHDLIYIALELCLINLEDEMEIKLLNLKPKIINRACANGVSYLHAKGILHRDIKPANILLNKMGQVKISDFGLSKELQIGASSASVSGVVGTADWMAPEILLVLLNTEEALEFKMTYKSDIWSLGCVFLFALTNGKHPYGDRGDREYHIRRNQPQNLSLVEPKWRTLISAMISFSPAARPTIEGVLHSDCFLENIEYVTETLKPDLQDSLSSGDLQHISAGKTVTPQEEVYARTVEDLIVSLKHRLNISLEFATQLKHDINAKTVYGDTLLHLAILHGVSRNVLETILECGGNWKEEHDKGETVLHVAAEAGNVEALKYFIEFGANIEARSSMWETPMHRLVKAKGNFIEALQVLVENGAEINAVDKNGNTPILLATCIGRNKSELEAMIQMGANWKTKNENRRSILHAAAEGGNIPALKHFISLGADINARDFQDETPLHLAVHPTHNFKGCLKILIDSGADIHAIDSYGNNLVLLAARAKKPTNVIEYMADLGCNWKLKNKHGATLLHYLAQDGSSESLKYFVEKGGDVNAKNDDADTPLHRAVLSNNFCEKLDILVEHGADVNALNKGGNTVLMCAVDVLKSKKEVEKIVEHGGDWNIRNDQLISVLHKAVKKGQYEVLEYFILKGMDINTRDSSGFAPLHFLCGVTTNFDETARTLLRYNVDLNVRAVGRATIFDMLPNFSIERFHRFQQIVSEMNR